MYTTTLLCQHWDVYFFRFLTRTRPAFAQYRTDFRQTKIAVRSLARASGESNAREWWVPVRVFAAGCVCVCRWCVAWLLRVLF